MGFRSASFVIGQSDFIHFGFTSLEIELFVLREKVCSGNKYIRL